MHTSCFDLLSLKYFQNIKLIAGRKGLSRNVTWPFICTTPTVSQWLHGGELLFITGAGISTDEASLEALMLDCIAKEIAGIDIVTGNKYITSISPSLINIADKSDFPLFEMSWNIKLIDVTQEISELIIANKDGFKNPQRFLERLLFSSDESDSYNKLSELYNIPHKPYHFIAVINFVPSEEMNYILGFAKNDMNRSLSQICKNKSALLLTTNLNDSIVCFASADDKKHIQHLVNTISDVFNQILDRYIGIHIYLGFSRIYGEDKDPKTQSGYKEANHAIQLMKKDIYDGTILHYSEIGTYKLLFAIKDVDEIKSFYMENIGCLIESDKRDSRELIATLRCYLENNCNLVNTAQDLFIHRNTLVYRLSIIKELLKKDLNDSSIRLELYNSLLAYDLMEKQCLF